MGFGTLIYALAVLGAVSIAGNVDLTFAQSVLLVMCLGLAYAGGVVDTFPKLAAEDAEDDEYEE